jgi:predicted porin
MSAGVQTITPAGINLMRAFSPIPVRSRLKPLAALLLTLGATSAAHSQVVLYGLIDTGFRNDRTATGRVNSIVPGVSAGSRWGIRATEDLGGGLRAQANLESGFSSDTGTSAQGGRLFGRRAIVALSGNFGSVELGRQTTPLWRVAAATDAFDGLMLGNPSSNVFVRANTQYVRADNGIWYISPNLSGLNVQLLWAPGESTAAGVSGSAGSWTSGSVVYAKGGFSVQYAALRNSGGTNLTSTQAKAETLHHLGATYTLGAFKLFAEFGTAERDAGAGTGALARVDHRSSALSATYTQGPHKVLAGYGVLEDRAVANADTSVWALGYQYSLSKRTMVYAGWSKRSNDANAQYLLLDGATNGALTTASVPRGFDPSAWTFGLRHSF